MFNGGKQMYNFMSSFGSGTVIKYGSGSDFLTSYGSGSTSQKVTVPTVPVPVPQHWIKYLHNVISICENFCDFISVPVSLRQVTVPTVPVPQHFG
jgi:hypothetical protein